MLTILLGLKIKFESDDVGNRFFVVSILPVAIAFLVHSYTVHKSYCTLYPFLRYACWASDSYKVDTSWDRSFFFLIVVFCLRL